MTSQKILLVENDKDLVRSTVDILQSRNYAVDVACSGADALQRLHHAPHLVLIDYALPDMCGIEICRKIKSDERWHSIAVVVLTDSLIAPEEMESLYIYGDDHLAKPFDPVELLARLEIVLRARQGMYQLDEEKQVIIAELNKILRQELLVPFFQPIYSSTSMKILGFEALSRPVTNTALSNPELFFKAALAFGVYTDLEKLAWRKAFGEWKKRLGRGKLFLNCTPYFIGNNSMEKGFFTALGVDPREAVVELTERAAIHNQDLFVEKVEELRGLGMQIAVDDVGSGFASLDTVADVRPEYIKIDLKLIRDINFNSLKRNIVQAVITFCHQSDILTVAEGIEERAELQAVRDLGIDAVQGYLLGKPSPEINKDIFEKKFVV